MATLNYEIPPGTKLLVGDFIFSEDKNFYAAFKSNGNLIAYPFKRPFSDDVIWSTLSGPEDVNRNLEKKIDSPQLHFQHNGELVLYGSDVINDSNITWRSETYLTFPVYFKKYYFDSSGAIVFKYRRESTSPISTMIITQNIFKINLDLKIDAFNQQWRFLKANIGCKLNMKGQFRKIGQSSSSTSNETGLSGQTYLEVQEMSGGSDKLINSSLLPQEPLHTPTTCFSNFELTGSFTPAIKARNLEDKNGVPTNSGIELSLVFSKKGHKPCLALYKDDGSSLLIKRWSISLNTKLSISPGNSRLLETKRDNPILLPSPLEYSLTPFEGLPFYKKLIYAHISSDTDQLIGGLSVTCQSIQGDLGDDINDVKNCLKVIALGWMKYFLLNGNPFVVSQFIVATYVFKNDFPPTPWQGITGQLLPIYSGLKTIQAQDPADPGFFRLGVKTGRQYVRLDNGTVCEEEINYLAKIKKDGRINISFDVLIGKLLLQSLHHNLKTLELGFPHTSVEFQQKAKTTNLNNQFERNYQVVEYGTEHKNNKFYQNQFSAKFTLLPDSHKVNLKLNGLFNVNMPKATGRVKLTWALGCHLIITKNGRSQQVIKSENDPTNNFSIDLKISLNSGAEKKITDIKQLIKGAIFSAIKDIKEGIVLPYGEIFIYSNPEIDEQTLDFTADLKLNIQNISHI